MGTRSFISIVFSLDIVGNFSFSYNIVNIYVLLTNSLLWIAYPRVVEELTINHISNTSVVYYLMGLIKKIFLLQLLLSITAFATGPLISYLFPAYKLSMNFFYILMLSSIYSNLTFPIVTFFMSRGKYWNLIKISTYSIIFGLILFCIIYYYKLIPIYAVLAYFFTLLVYFNLLVNELYSVFKFSNENLKTLYNLKIQVLIILVFIPVLFKYYFLALIILFIIALIFFKDFKLLYNTIRKLYL